jgi:hypothetical protein
MTRTRTLLNRTHVLKALYDDGLVAQSNEVS